MRQRRTEFAILGMLMQGPMSGYDLKLQFEERIANFWSESAGQIYPALKRLVAAKLATAKEKSRNAGPRRVEYRITKKGRAVLQSWLHEPVARESVRNELMLKIFFGAHVDVETGLRHIEAFEAVQKTVQAQFNNYAQRIEEEPVSEIQKEFWRLTLRSGQLVNEARLKWCREAKKVLEQHSPGQD